MGFCRRKLLAGERRDDALHTFLLTEPRSRPVNGELAQAAKRVNSDRLEFPLGPRRLLKKYTGSRAGVLRGSDKEG